MSLVAIGPVATTVLVANPSVVGAGTLQGGWLDRSWDGLVAKTSTGLRFSPTARCGAFNTLAVGRVLDTRKYSNLRLDLAVGSLADYRVRLVDTANAKLTSVPITSWVTSTTSTGTRVDIPLSALGAVDRSIYGIQVMSSCAKKGQAITIKEARFTSTSPNGIFGLPLANSANPPAAEAAAALLAAGRTADAQAITGMTGQPTATWIGDWTTDVTGTVQQIVSSAASQGKVASLVVYNAIRRDCASYSQGGATDSDAYRAWIAGFVAGLGNTRAIVILEPDALAQLDCLPVAMQTERLALLSYATSAIAGQGSWVYLDAGHSGWNSASVTASRLTAAGIDKAAGFSLNVSNYRPTEDEIAYGSRVSDLLGGGVHFVIDTSRNGGTVAPSEWCNANGARLGASPQLSTSNPRVDAYLWVKRPGESDGTCNSGPNAGLWWTEYALMLAGR